MVYRQLRAHLAGSLAAAALLVVAGSAGAQAPAALVESVENAPDAGVSFLDYVYPGQSIRLGRSGTAKLSYFDSCTLETVTGGTVTVQPGASRVSGGRVKTEEMPCQGEQIYVVAESSEAGAAVNRMGSTSGGNEEWTIKSLTPVFVWPDGGSGTIEVVDIDLQPPQVVWRGQVKGGKAEYPKDAPELQAGFPYQVTLKAGGEEFRTVFTIDPYLDLPDTAISRVVPLR